MRGLNQVLGFRAVQLRTRTEVKGCKKYRAALGYIVIM